MIQLDNVSFSYGSQVILKNITHTFKSGKYHMILGPSGNGKSTLLKLIAGFLKPQSGALSKPANYGYVLQEGGLFSHLNISQNISIQGLNESWSKQKITLRIQQLCDLTRFSTDLLMKFPEQISGGQKQRVALMRSLFLDPEVLLFDESLTGLDPLLKYILMKDLSAIIKDLKKTVLHVTHDLVEASILADEILLLKDGKVEEATDKVSFFKNPVSEFSQQYIQSQKVVI